MCLGEAPARGTCSAQLEFDLILCCARASPDAETIERIYQLAEQRIDWDLLIRLAARHNLTSLLGWNLHKVCPDLVPEHVLSKLAKDFDATAAHNLFLTSELHRISETLRENGIPAIAFKGPVLAFLAYQNIALRNFGDLDILIHRKDIIKAGKALASIDYRLPPRLRNPRVLRLRYEYAFPLLKQKGPQIDLHCEVAPWFFSFSLNTRDLFERIVDVPLPGGFLSSLAFEDLLLILCMHGAKHLWCSLESIACIAGLLRATPQLCWDDTLTRARQTGAERMLLLGCALVHNLFGEPLPNEIELLIRRDRSVAELAVFVQKRLLYPSNPPPLMWSAPLFHIQCRERLRDRWRYLSRGLLWPELDDVLCFKLPGFLFPLYRLLHPARVLSEYSKLALQRLLSATK